MPSSEEFTIDEQLTIPCPQTLEDRESQKIVFQNSRIHESRNINQMIKGGVNPYHHGRNSTFRSP